jgi:hypothetical protein
VIARALPPRVAAVATRKRIRPDSREAGPAGSSTPAVLGHDWEDARTGAREAIDGSEKRLMGVSPKPTAGWRCRHPGRCRHPRTRAMYFFRMLVYHAGAGRLLGSDRRIASATRPC